MAEPKGIQWLDNSYIIGTRSDLAPTPLPRLVFTHQCGRCHAKTLTETEYPDDIPVICNICAGEVTEQIEQDSSTQLLYTMPDDLKARLLDLAYRQRLPVEEVFKDFLAWKLRRPPNTPAHKPAKQKTEK